MIVVEVERPNTDITQRRIEFYKKVGFKLNKYDYIQPPYGVGKNPVPMFLMTFPNKIKESEFILIRKKLHSDVYGLKEPIAGCKN